MSTLVVSWNDAAEMNDELCTDALVIPNSCVDAVDFFGLAPLAISPPSDSIWALVCSSASLGTIEPTAYSLSPLSVMRRHFATASFAERKSNLSITAPGNKLVSPGDSIFTFRNICETMISMCLSLIFTLCERYTF